MYFCIFKRSKPKILKRVGNTKKTNKMKKTLFCALAFASVLFLASCGDSKNAEEAENDEMEMVESSTNASDLDYAEDYDRAMQEVNDEFDKAMKEVGDEYEKAMKEAGDEYEKAMKEAEKAMQDIDF